MIGQCTGGQTVPCSSEKEPCCCSGSWLLMHLNCSDWWLEAKKHENINRSGAYGCPIAPSMSMVTISLQWEWWSLHWNKYCANQALINASRVLIGAGSDQMKKKHTKVDPFQNWFFVTNDHYWTGLGWLKPFLAFRGKFWVWGVWEVENLKFPNWTNFDREMQFFDINSL